MCVCMYQLLKHMTNCHKPCSNFMTLQVTQCLTFQFSSMSIQSMADMQICVTELASIQPAIVIHYGNNNYKNKSYVKIIMFNTSWLILVMSVFRNTSAGLKHLARRQSWHRSACIDVSCESNSWILRIACRIKSIPLNGTFNSAKLCVSRWHNSASAK